MQSQLIQSLKHARLNVRGTNMLGLVQIFADVIMTTMITIITLNSWMKHARQAVIPSLNKSVNYYFTFFCLLWFENYVNVIFVQDHISMECPLEGRINNEIICNATIFYGSAFANQDHSIFVYVNKTLEKTVTWQDSSLNSSKSQLSFVLSKPGFFEIAARENHYNTTSSKIVYSVESKKFRKSTGSIYF